MSASVSALGQTLLTVRKTCERKNMCMGPSVKVGGVPQCSGEVEHCGTLGTPAPFQSSVEQCGMAQNGCALTPPVTTCQP